MVLGTIRNGWERLDFIDDCNINIVIVKNVPNAQLFRYS